jgi:hypothetical protein
LLAPENVIDVAEAQAEVALNSLLSFAIDEDTERYGGLGLRQWLRVFALLRVIARERYSQDGVPGLLPVLSCEEVIANFVSAGLSEGEARTALAVLCLGRRSRDAFDTPLLRVGMDSVVLFGPALVAANIAQIVLSVAHTVGTLEKKGSAFEERVRQIFEAQVGIRVTSLRLKTKRSEYQYDALVEWGDYLFVLECKNRGLPPADPISEARFLGETEKDAVQLRRLVTGLTANAERVSAEIGCDVASKTIVPCIVHAMPVGMPQTEDGIYTVDGGIIERFFENRHFRILQPHKVGEITILHRISFGPQWQGERPTPEDFLRLLNAPPQVASVLNGLTLKPVWFHLDSDTVGAYVRVNSRIVTLDEDVQLLGGNAESVREHMAQMAAMSERLRQGLAGADGDGGDAGNSTTALFDDPIAGTLSVYRRALKE